MNSATVLSVVIDSQPVYPYTADSTHLMTDDHDARDRHDEMSASDRNQETPATGANSDPPSDAAGHHDADGHEEPGISTAETDSAI